MSERFDLGHGPLTKQYVINDTRHKIIFPTTTSKPQALRCIEFLNNQEDKIQELDAKASSWKITAGEQLHDTCQAEAKLKNIQIKFDERISKLEEQLEYGVKKGYPTGIIQGELDLLYELKEDLLL